jgi:hypothetical protein
MDQAPLVDKKIDDGRRLIDALRESGLDLRLAFWLYTEDFADWRLLIGTPQAADQGPISVYKKIQPILKNLNPAAAIRLDEITVVGPSDPIYREFDAFLSRYPTRLSTRIRRTPLGDVYVDEAYVYPTQPPPVIAAGIDDRGSA